MREKNFIRTLTCLCVVMMACGTAFAQQGKIRSGPYQGPMRPMAGDPEAPNVTFFSNFQTDACTGCDYSGANGYFVLGLNNCFTATPAQQWIAYPFVSAATGAVRRVSMAITDYGLCAASSTRFTVAIYTDACNNVPDTQIGSAVIANAPAAPCLKAVANFGAAGVSLTAGTKYWLVATTSSAPTQIGTTAVWWMANSAWAPYNLNDGNGWVAFPDGAPGAFSVQ